jgi:hypothetical protein
MVKLYVNSACVLYGWRKLILTSLAKLTHCLLRYEAGTVVKGSDGWQDLCSPMGFEIPLLLVECVSELRLYNGGFRCLPFHDGMPCHYVCRSVKGLEEHWRKRHGWKVQPTRGGSGHTQRVTVARHLAKAMRDTRCLRFFLHGQTSSFLEDY